MYILTEYPYENAINETSELLQQLNWTENQIHGQIETIKRLYETKNGKVCIARWSDQTVGYLSVEYYEWNRLGQIHGLVVHPEFRRKGIASELVKAAEYFLKEIGARGTYVDTPTENLNARSFYQMMEYKQAYIMPHYYDHGVDGVTYQKFF